MCSISAYEVDPCILYFMHACIRLKDILILILLYYLEKKIKTHMHASYMKFQQWYQSHGFYIHQIDIHIFEKKFKI